MRSTGRSVYDALITGLRDASMGQGAPEIAANMLRGLISPLYLNVAGLDRL